MKRKLIIVAGILFLCIGVLAILPFIYKDSLLTKVKTTLNAQINASVNFNDFQVSVFSQFPKIEIKLLNLSVVGVKEFAQDTLFSANSISTTISLMDMISGKGLELKGLTINDPKISLIVNKKGAANWNVIKTANVSEGKVVNQTSDSKKSFSMKLTDIQLNNLNMLYLDQSMPMMVQLKKTTLKSSGDIAGTVTSFDLTADADEFIFEYDSVKYISNTRLKASTLLKVDYDKMNFTFGQTKLLVNQLPLDIDGSFSMPNDSMHFDLAFRSEKSDFVTILALVPTSYQKYIEKAKIDGSAEFKGSVKGVYYKEIYPAINVLLAVNNASFKYQNLPESVQNIQVSAEITKPEGDLNLLNVKVEKAHASVRNNPVDLQLSLSEMMTDPNIDAAFSGKIDFASLKQAIPLDSLNISGQLTAKLQMSGRMSSIEKQEYEKFKSKGEATIQNFKLESKQLTKPVEISLGQLTATTQQISITKFDGKIGQSDFALRGDVRNYLAYFFKKEVLKGNLSLKSTYMDFSELSNIQKPTKALSKGAATKSTTVASSDSVVAFHVPEKLDISFVSAIQHAVYDKMPITNINGQINVKDQRIELSNLSMEMLKGKLGINGSYTCNKENKPRFDFKLNMEKMDLPSAYQSLSTFRRYVPIAAMSQGTFSTQFNLTGAMNEKMDIVPTSLNGLGVFNTQNLMIVNAPVFEQIKGIIKKEKLKNVSVEDFTAKFQFQNGELTLNPFKTSIAGQQTTIFGTLSAARNINLNMDFVVNRDDLGSDINKGLGILPGSQNIKTVEVSVILKGAITKPEVSIDLSKARKQIEQEVKKASSEEIKSSVKKLGNELKKFFK